MKKIILLLILLIVAVSAAPLVAFAEEPKEVSAKAVFVTDGSATDEIYAKNADERYPIASMVKIMTALLTVEAIDRGECTIDESVTISSEASGMGGSQMFLDSGLSYKLGDLLKGVIVVSANDACVALAERLKGSEEQFVVEMNDRAKALGMDNTHFANCTGLPASGGYSSARDVAKMLAELQRYPVYKQYSNIWLEDFTHPDGRTTTFTNTNKMIRFYEGCDGGKTGFTNEAGFCLAATAERQGMRFISVVIGESDSKTRFKDSTKLLNQAFALHQKCVLVQKDEILGEQDIKNAKSPLKYKTAEELRFVTKKGQERRITTNIKLDVPELPIEQGQIVGVLYAVENGKVIGEVDLVAVENVDKMTYGDAVDRVLGEW